MVAVARVEEDHRLVGDGSLVEFGNRWLDHLRARRFSPATVRAYAFDLLCLARFFEEAGLDWREANPTDFFDWLEWQADRLSRRASGWCGQGGRGPAAATMNRRIAAARGRFDHAVMCDVLERNPVTAPLRSSGLRGSREGLLGHVRRRRASAPALLVREQRRLPESLDVEDVSVFLADLGTHRDPAVVVLMLLGGLRSAEVGSLRLADVDMGLRQVTVVGKGAKQPTVPVDRVLFTELGSYLRIQRPRVCPRRSVSWCHAGRMPAGP